MNNQVITGSCFEGYFGAKIAILVICFAGSLYSDSILIRNRNHPVIKYRTITLWMIAHFFFLSMLITFVVFTIPGLLTVRTARIALIVHYLIIAGEFVAIVCIGQRYLVLVITPSVQAQLTDRRTVYVDSFYRKVVREIRLCRLLSSEIVTLWFFVAYYSLFSGLLLYFAITATDEDILAVFYGSSSLLPVFFYSTLFAWVLLAMVMFFSTIATFTLSDHFYISTHFAITLITTAIIFSIPFVNVQYNTSIAVKQALNIAFMVMQMLLLFEEWLIFMFVGIKYDEGITTNEEAAVTQRSAHFSFSVEQNAITSFINVISPTLAAQLSIGSGKTVRKEAGNPDDTVVQIQKDPTLEEIMADPTSRVLFGKYMASEFDFSAFLCLNALMHLDAIRTVAGDNSSDSANQDVDLALKKIVEEFIQEGAVNMLDLPDRVRNDLISNARLITEMNEDNGKKKKEYRRLIIDPLLSYLADVYLSFHVMKFNRNRANAK